MASPDVGLVMTNRKIRESLHCNLPRGQTPGLLEIDLRVVLKHEIGWMLLAPTRLFVIIYPKLGL